MIDITYTKDFSRIYVFNLNRSRKTINCIEYSSSEVRFRDPTDICEVTLPYDEELDPSHLVFAIRNYQKKVKPNEKEYILNFLNDMFTGYTFEEKFTGPQFMKYDSP